MGYIRVPIETNPEVLAQDIFDYIQIQQPGWTPADGNLDTWIIRAVAAKAAENRSLASDVPDDIFANLGASLFSVPPVDAVPATGTSTWTLSNTAGHTIPDGTYIGLRDAAGNLVTFVTVGDVVVAPGDSVTAVGEVVIRAIDEGVVGNALTDPATLIDVIDWVTSIDIVGSTSGGLDAETNEVYLNRLSNKLQSLSTVPILMPDFVNAAKEASPGVFRAVAVDMYNPAHNLLTANQASAETDASGWTNLGNTTIGSSSAQAASGSKSVSLTAIAGADMAIGSPVAASGAGAIAVLPGEVVTGLASIRANTTVRSCRAQLNWYTSAGAFISATNGTAANDSNSAWTAYSVTGTAPATAAFVRVIVYVIAAAIGEVHYADKMSLRKGSTTDWVAGDTAETGNIKTVTIAAVDSTGTSVSTGIKTAIANYINARREVNWITHVMDPNYTSIDVSVSFKLLPSYNSTSTEDAVEAAFTNYFDKANWGRDPSAASGDAATTWVDQTVVYYNELIALASGIAGVDRVTDLTVNVTGSTPARVDVILSSPATLTTVGTIEAEVV